MDLVFKVVTTPAPAVPVVADTNIQDHFTGMNSQFAWKEVKPTIEQATDNYILPFIGEELYSDLASKYQAGTALTTKQARTLQLLQRAVIYYAAYSLMSEKIAALTPLGVVQNTPDGGSVPTNQWSFTEKKLDLLSKADTALDKLLQYLDEQTDAYFDLFFDSEAAQYKTANWIKHTKDLDEYVNIKQSRRSFVSIVPHIARAERDILEPLLCSTLYNALKTPTTDAQLVLIPYLKEIAAYKGAAAALPHHRIVIDGDGFRVVSQTDGFTDRRNLTNSVHEQAVGALLTAYHERGDKAIRALMTYLEANLDTYPDYRDSTCRTKPTDKSHGIMASPDGIGAVGIF